jgi:uncharacterized protein YbaR (Trm112 family)/drug/metabolite transporter (DMT)-like permease
VIAHAGIILALLATIVYSLGFILEKRALTDLPTIDAHHLWRLVRTLFTAPAWLGGFVLICGGLVLQVVVLSLEPLTIAQPLQASGLVATIVLSRLMLHERLGRAELACIGIMAAAVVLLTLSSGRGADGAAGTHAAGTAIAAAAAPAVLAGLVIYGLTARASRRRHRHPVTGVSYSLGAGLMYGVTGLALKALSATVLTSGGPVAHSRTALIVTAIRSPYLYMALGGLAAGMCLFQTALQRGKASVVIPVSTIISTGYLVVVGSWLFHERLPAGPVPLAMRLGGAVAALAVPVILTVASDRASAPASALVPATDPAAGHAAADHRPAPAPGKAPAMSLDPLLLNLLACPIDKQALLYLAEDGVLYNPRLRRLYRLRDGIPVMLADQGETVGDSQHRDLLRRAAAGGVPATLQVPLRDLLAEAGTMADPVAGQAEIPSGAGAVHAGQASSGEDAA